MSAPDQKQTAHTAGPWAWMGSPHGIYLATTHSGRQYVMGFRRMGFNGAQPVFRDNHKMVPAADIVQFEVGDRSVRGFSQAKDTDCVYRYDVDGIDNADARLIAAAPDMLDALIGLTAGLPDLLKECGVLDEENLVEKALGAIARATGSSSQSGGE